MAHPINDKLNRLEGRTKVPCNESCKYWAFPHLGTSCVLSSVFSVKKGQLCFEYTKKEAVSEKEKQSS